MSRHRFDVAGPADDFDLRRILRATPMPGRITVSFRREPNFFDAATVEGSFYQAIIARNGSGNAIGLGCRSVRGRYVNGEPHPVGYLSSLRLLPEYRGSGIVARAYQYLRTLHEDGRAQVYLTTIARGNELATPVLTSHRAGLPCYHFAGDYHTLVIPMRRRVNRLKRIDAGLEIREATPADATEIVDFLGAVGPMRQFFPVYEPTDLFSSSGTFRDLMPHDILLAIRQGRLVGTLARWDQSRFRQTVVEAYCGYLRWTRPIYNCWAAARRTPQLPAPGNTFRYLTAAFPIVENDDANVFERLLQEAVCIKLRKQHSLNTYLLLGLHECDPLLPIATTYGAHSYQTHLYHVCWEDGESFRQALDDRPPYLELGCL